MNTYVRIFLLLQENRNNSNVRSSFQTLLTRWWFQPLWTILYNQRGSFTQRSGWKSKIVETKSLKFPAISPNICRSISHLVAVPQPNTKHPDKTFVTLVGGFHDKRTGYIKIMISLLPKQRPSEIGDSLFNSPLICVYDLCICFRNEYTSRWCFQPSWEILVKLNHFLNRGQPANNKHMIWNQNTEDGIKIYIYMYYIHT